MRSSPQLEDAQAEDTVEFRIEQDEKAAAGYQAVDVHFIKNAATDMIGNGKVRGWVKSFRGGWGFLNSHRIDGDIFVGQNANKHIDLQGLQPQTPVEFELSADPKSKRGVEAVNVMTRQQHLPVANSFVQQLPPGFVQRPTVFAGSFNNAILPQVGMVKYPKGGGLGKGGGFNMQQPGKGGGFNMQQLGKGGVGKDLIHLAMTGIRCTGQIRSFKGEWGFAISDMFDGDVFVGLRSNPALPATVQEGQQIEFTIQANPSNGKSKGGFEATNCKIIFGRKANSAKMRSRSPKRGSIKPWGGARDPRNFVGQVLRGWIRSFKGSWGFVNSDDFDGDIFVGARANPELVDKANNLDQVQFEVAEQNGKIEAINATLLE